MKIEWASSFHPDGSRRKPPPSSVHGWLAKMRGTLLGNEELRSKGMREMAAARRVKADRRRAQSGRSVFGFFNNRKQSAPRSTSSRQRPNTLSRPPQSRHVSGTSRGAGSSSRRPSMTPRASHNSRSSKSRPQYTSRSSQPRPQYISRRSTRR